MRRMYALISLALSSHLLAQQPISIDMEVENIASEFATCAAYYRLVAFGSVASNRADLASAYRELEDEAMFYSLLLASEGRDRDMSVKVTNARIEVSMKSMKEEIDNRNENISILIHKYNEHCIEMSEEPPAPVQRVLAKKLQEVSEKK